MKLFIVLATNADGFNLDVLVNAPDPTIAEHLYRAYCFTNDWEPENVRVYHVQQSTTAAVLEWDQDVVRA